MGKANLELLQFASADEIKARTDEKIRSLINHAYHNVPYYRHIFNKLGIHWSDIKEVDDLKLLPPLTRRTVKQNFPEGLVAENIPQKRRNLTSTTGSTGIPLKFFTDTESAIPRSLVWDFLDKWAGVRPDFNRVWLGAPRPIPRFNPRHPISTWIKRKKFRQPNDLISVFMLRAETVFNIIEEIQKKVPYYIYGISSSIRFIANQIQDQSISMTKLPRSIIGTSDTLLPLHLKALKQIFECPVFSRYGSYEMGGGVAQTCPDVPGVMHVIPETVILEIVDDAGVPLAPGMSGRILLTEVTNYVMPFIRYDTGDIGVASGTCSCGRVFPTIREILGRDYEQVRTPSGQTIHSWEFEVYLFYIKDYRKYIVEYEIIQHENNIILRVIPSKSFLKKTGVMLKTDLQRIIGDDMSVEIEHVKHIEYRLNGKKSLIRII